MKAAKAHKERYGEPQVAWDDHGVWVTCPCGWRSKTHPTVNLAAHEYAAHSDGSGMGALPPPGVCPECGRWPPDHQESCAQYDGTMEP